MGLRKASLEISKIFHVSVKWNKEHLLTSIYHCRPFWLTAGLLLARKSYSGYYICHLVGFWNIDVFFSFLSFMAVHPRRGFSADMRGHNHTRAEFSCKCLGPMSVWQQTCCQHSGGAVPKPVPSSSKDPSTCHRNRHILSTWELAFRQCWWHWRVPHHRILRAGRDLQDPVPPLTFPTCSRS